MQSLICRIEVFDVIRQLQRWLSTSIAGIDSEDAKLIEAVSSHLPTLSNDLGLKNIMENVFGNC